MTFSGLGSGLGMRRKCRYLERMKNLSNSERIRSTIKLLLKRHDYTYEDLAKTLCLSKAAVKRLMTKGEFTLDRLEVIADWFGISLFELIEVTKKSEPKVYHLSPEQEKALGDNPKTHYILLQLSGGFAPLEIQDRLGLTPAQMHRHCLILEDIGLVEILAKNRIRLRAKGPYPLDPKGTLYKKYYRRWIAVLTSHLSPEPELGENKLLFELHLSKGLQDKMYAELVEVYQRYRQLSRLEKENTQRLDLETFSGLFFTKAFDSWKEILWDSNSGSFT